MAYFKKLPHDTRESKVTYATGIVNEIVLLAVVELDYVKVIYKKGDEIKDVIKINISKNYVDVWIEVQIHFTQSVSEMAFKIQESVRHNIETMTEYKVNSVNVKISGIFYDPIENDKKPVDFSAQEKISDDTKTSSENIKEEKDKA